MSQLEEATKLIGKIKVIDIQDLEDGSCKVIFEYDEEFKKEYKRLFNLKRWSKRHFQKNLDKAIANFAEKVKIEKALLGIEDDPST